MRLVRFLFCYVLLSVFGVVLALFLAQNWGTTHVSFFGQDYSVHLAWILAGAAAFGALITLVLLLPGRLAAMVYRWGLERELRQWEQDLWKVQERYGRLLSRHERLLDAHERVLQAHHRLVGEHSQVAAERDQVRSQLAQVASVAQLTAARTSAAQQPARVPSVPRVAVVASSSPGSPGSPVSTGERPAIIATSRLRVHDVRGGKASASAPRWAVPCPPGRPASVSVPIPASASAPAAQATGATSQVAADDLETDEAREALPAASDMPVVPAVHQPVMAEQPPFNPVPAAAPAVMPLPVAGEPALRAAPRTVPILSTEPVASSPAAAADSATRADSPVIALRSLRRAAERAIASVSPLLAELRSWLRTTLSSIRSTLEAQRDLLAARLAQLKQSIVQGEEWQPSARKAPAGHRARATVPLDPDASRASSASVELPGGK